MSKKITKIGVLVFTVLITLLGFNLAFNTQTFAQSYEDDLDWDWEGEDWDSSDYDFEYEWEAGYGDTQELPAWMGLPFFICSCLIGLGMYVYFALVIAKLAEKTGHKDKKILAWIPLANVYLMTVIADKPMWWVFLLIVGSAIPFINLVAFVFWILLWMELAKAAKHPKWFGILILVPLIGFFVPGYLAFVEGKEVGTQS
ncbi:hypothetical protein GF362_06370 [Candidatus Dojkabacteria bacterium]|nr:hypothetical protein [Candidatus Dojkabacteria bacterium]